MKKVNVIWEDSRGYGTVWMDDEDIEKIDISHCESVGFVYKEDKDKIILAQSHGNGQYHNLIAIPKRSIVKRK